MKTIVFILAALAATAGISVEPVAQKKPIKITPEQAKAMRDARMAKNGGEIEKVGAMKGKIAIIDTQKKADIEKDTLETLRYFERGLRFNMAYEKTAPKEAEALMSASKADFAVIIVDDETTPAILVAPEDHWAKVNVAKLARGFKSIEERKQLFDERCAKATLKAFSLLCGGGASKYPGSVFSTSKMEDLDIVHGKVPVDMLDRYRSFLKGAGLSPRIVASYRRACMDGWAPAPTNDVQKAIWAEVHEKPTKPLKIEYDPKKGE